MEASQLLFKVGRCIHEGAVCENGRGIPPLRLLLVKHSHVPKYAVALAAARSRGKLVAQLLCDEMVIVPELDNACI